MKELTRFMGKVRKIHDKRFWLTVPRSLFVAGWLQHDKDYVWSVFEVPEPAPEVKDSETPVVPEKKDSSIEKTSEGL